MSRYSSILVAILAGVAFSACNTISGAGQDIQAAGGAVEEVAEDTKDELTDDDEG